MERTDKAEADNAALTARVKEQQDEIASLANSLDGSEHCRKAIENQLAAAKKALTEIYGNGDATGCNPQIKVDIARAALEVQP